MKKKKLIFFFSLILLFSISIGIYFRYYFEISSKNQIKKSALYIDIETENRKREEREKDFIAAMKADVYGGKTPEETLKLFIEALKAGDVELASKYFYLETDSQDPNYLTRKKWEDYLYDLKSKNLLQIMAEDIERDAKPLTSEVNENKIFRFGLFNEDGTVGVSIDLKFNPYSRVWKIKSL